MRIDLHDEKFNKKIKFEKVFKRRRVRSWNWKGQVFPAQPVSMYVWCICAGMLTGIYIILVQLC